MNKKNSEKLERDEFNRSIIERLLIPESAG